MVVMVDQDDYGNRGGHGLADHDDYCGGHGPDNDHDIVVVLILMLLTLVVGEDTSSREF